jgi:hypothetical protein
VSFRGAHRERAVAFDRRHALWAMCLLVHGRA